ncbi:MAG TPA: hypothetical protein VF629_17720 [Hymenobacter sp.]|jgi:hypothetical protein|uniref:hypothetical protein n=1 Tax=Hymenobacter sp. TaxID=1898978 RepID=UPI002EDB46C0
MPKLIDYPRTTYSGAWELAEIVDDTGGKSAIETAARKLNRKVSGSFKAIIGSAVKFGLLTSKRDLLTTTTLFKRIKHAYDKQEELVFHREAFLTPPLFTQICRKFRSRELPVQMLDVMLIREFGVEEINAQGVAKAFVEGCRMVGLLDEHNIIADIDALPNKQSPRRELASPPPTINSLRVENSPTQFEAVDSPREGLFDPLSATDTSVPSVPPQNKARPMTEIKSPSTDLIASLFGLVDTQPDAAPTAKQNAPTPELESAKPSTPKANPQPQNNEGMPVNVSVHAPTGYQIQVSGPGVNTSLSITDEEDISIAIALLEKIRRQLKA